MDETNGRRETHDFMNVNVESFSQLPFIRRTPPPSKEKASKIRLFGQELIGDNSSSQQQDLQDLSADSSDLTTTTKNDQETSHEDVKEKDKDKDNNRRFECHYCFRNFPTSQALGGHQNAHKRERQHAKRGSMTSYLNHHDHPHHHVYGYLNHHHHRQQYPSWTSDARTFYGGGGGQQQTSPYYSRSALSSTPPTINGSPLGLWRVPSSTTSSVYSSSASTFRTHEQEANKEPNWSYRMMKPNVQDHVSLDLHL